MIGEHQQNFVDDWNHFKTCLHINSELYIYPAVHVLAWIPGQPFLTPAALSSSSCSEVLPGILESGSVLKSQAVMPVNVEKPQLHTLQFVPVESTIFF